MNLEEIQGKMGQESLDRINALLHPKQLSYVQEMVFLQSWQGKMYREIATESGYDIDYIKEVGSQLWAMLSDVTGEKITKKSARMILTQRSPLDASTSPRAQKLVPANFLEFPTGSVPLHSTLYLDRPPIETRINDEITRPGGFVRIRAPRQMGKTSLLLRALAYARKLGYRKALLNFHQIDRQVLSNTDQFLRWMCLYLGQQLGLPAQLDQHWDTELGSKISCTAYLQNYLLPQAGVPVVFAMDDIHDLFPHALLAQDFLSLLRHWHETAAESSIWQNFRLVIAHSTEAYVPLAMNQSPFNVGVPVMLPEFNRSQVMDLIHRYELDEMGVTDAAVDRLMQLVGGHPYLIRLALHWLRQGETSLERLLQEAPTQAGIYSNTLRRHWEVLQQRPLLLEAIQRLMATPTGIQLDALVAHQLDSMGLVTLKGNQAQLRNDLYRQFLLDQLGESAAAR
jgi:hypothetical protein